MRVTDVAIIGTGFGGLGAAIRLKQEGIGDFVVLERSDDVGGTWVSGGCRSWYLDRTGRNSTLWPDSSWRFYRRVSRFNPAEYQAQA